jgi:ankyrin repeat protein
LLDEHSARIDFSIGEKDGYTPMHGAGFQGRADIARLLIAAGLDPSDRHKVSMHPLQK